MKVTSKISNAKLLLHTNYTSTYIPEIEILTPFSLVTMLKKYPFVYVKPNDSCRGKGVLRVDQIRPTTFMLRSRDYNTTSIHNHLHSLWSSISQLRRNRMYVVQQGISSITKSGRHFDIRAHMTRVNGEWLVAGMIGNIARNGGIITTESSGGTSMHVHHMLEKHLGFSKKKVAETIHQLQSISLHATKAISRHYPTWIEFGLDLGIDYKNNIWIFEVNITPGALLFQKLGKKAFRRVLFLHRIAH